MKRVLGHLLTFAAGAIVMRFCMTNPKAKEFIETARKRGEEILKKGKEGKEEQPQPEQDEKR